MKKIQLFIIGKLPFLATIFGLQLFSTTQVVAQAAPKATTSVKVSNAAKAKVAVKAGAIKNGNAAASFVKEEGPSFVKSGAVVKGAAIRDVNKAASFVKEEGPSFVKSSSGINTNVKDVKIKAAANKAQK